VEQLEARFEEKRGTMSHSILGEHLQLASNGYIYSTSGALVTSSSALELEMKEEGRKRAEGCR